MYMYLCTQNAKSIEFGFSSYVESRHSITHLSKIIWLVGWLCFTSHRQQGHQETAPPFTVPCEGREARFLILQLAVWSTDDFWWWSIVMQIEAACMPGSCKVASTGAHENVFYITYCIVWVACWWGMTKREACSLRTHNLFMILS